MNKFTKWIVGAVCALALVTSAFAADTVATAKSTTALTTQTTGASLFNAGELGLSIGSAYTLGSAGTLNGKTLFNQPYTLNANAGAFWFPFRNLGLDATVPFYQSKGVSVSEVQAGLTLRLPLAKTTPIFKNLSPYIGLDGVYDWQDAAKKWAYIGKVGLEVRLNSKWGVFAEGQYRNYELSNWGQGQTSLNGGVHFVF